MMEKIIEIINDWDPIEVFPMAPKDEYIVEIELIYNYICSVDKLQSEQLAKKINMIFLKRFGKDIYSDDLNKCIVVADRIIKYYADKT